MTSRRIRGRLLFGHAAIDVEQTTVCESSLQHNARPIGAGRPEHRSVDDIAVSGHRYRSVKIHYICCNGSRSAGTRASPARTVRAKQPFAMARVSPDINTTKTPYDQPSPPTRSTRHRDRPPRPGSQQVAVQTRYVHGEQLLSHVRPAIYPAGSADVKRRPAIASHAAHPTRIAHHRRQQHLHGVVLRQIDVPSAQRLHPGHTIEFDQTINVDEVEKYFVAQRPLSINRADELRRRPTQPPTETLPVPLRRRIRTTTQQQNQLTVPKFAIKKTDVDCRRCCLGMPVLDRVAGARSQSLILVVTRHQMSEHNFSPVAPMQL